MNSSVHLELAENLTFNKFKKCFKRLIARRDRPKSTYSGNAKTFQAAVEKGLKKQVKIDEELHEFLIERKYNIEI